MARRTAFTAAKRQKERARTQKAEAKRARREGRDPSLAPEAPPGLDEMVDRLGQALTDQGLASADEPTDGPGDADAAPSGRGPAPPA